MTGTILPHLSRETLEILRDCHLSMAAFDAGFVRCRIPSTAAAHRAVIEINEAGVQVASNMEVMGGDYLRVDRGTRAFDLICHMKS